MFKNLKCSAWTSKGIKLAGSSLFAILVVAILLCVLVHLRDTLAWLSSALGLAAGWALGILAAPYESEQQRFREYAKLIAAFVTGWAVTKIDHFFDLLFDPARGPLVLNAIVGSRILLGLTCFLLVATITYVVRKYVSFGPGSEQPAPQQRGRENSAGE